MTARQAAHSDTPAATVLRRANTHPTHTQTQTSDRALAPARLCNFTWAHTPTAPPSCLARTYRPVHPARALATSYRLVRGSLILAKSIANRRPQVARTHTSRPKYPPLKDTTQRCLLPAHTNPHGAPLTSLPSVLCAYTPHLISCGHVPAASSAHCAPTPERAGVGRRKTPLSGAYAVYREERAQRGD